MDEEYISKCDEEVANILANMEEYNKDYLEHKQNENLSNISCYQRVRFYNSLNLYLGVTDYSTILLTVIDYIKEVGNKQEYLFDLTKLRLVNYKTYLIVTDIIRKIICNNMPFISSKKGTIFLELFIPHLPAKSALPVLVIETITDSYFNMHNIYTGQSFIGRVAKGGYMIKKVDKSNNITLVKHYIGKLTLITNFSYVGKIFIDLEHALFTVKKVTIDKYSSRLTTNDCCCIF